MLEDERPALSSIGGPELPILVSATWRPLGRLLANGEGRVKGWKEGGRRLPGL